MNVLRDKNGVVCVDENVELSPEHRKDMQRLPAVVDKLTEQMVRETPTVAVSALISVLSRVLLVAGGDPIKPSRCSSVSTLRSCARQGLSTDSDHHGSAQTRWPSFPDACASSEEDLMEGELNLTDHGAGAACPTCGKAAVFEHPDGQVRHCFSCGVNITSLVLVGVQGVLEDIFKASRQHMLDSAEVRTYLINERGLHPQVLIDSAVGVVPPDLDVTQLFLPKLEKAEAERTRVLEAPRKVGSVRASPVRLRDTFLVTVNGRV